MTVAFVAGATGYTGQGVVRALRALGVETWAHVRPDSRELPRFTAQFEALGARVDTTAWDPEAMRGRLAELKPDVVFALLGTTRNREARDQKEGRDSSYEAVDYGLSILLLEAVMEAKPPPRFVYLSSLGVSAGSRNAYLNARWRVEEAVRGSGLPHVLARPSFITGSDRAESRPGERIGAAVADTLLGGLAALGLKRPKDRFGSKTADELGQALVRLGLDPNTPSGVVESESLR